MWHDIARRNRSMQGLGQMQRVVFRQRMAIIGQVDRLPAVLGRGFGDVFPVVIGEGYLTVVVV